MRFGNRFSPQIDCRRAGNCLIITSLRGIMPSERGRPVETLRERSPQDLHGGSMNESTFLEIGMIACWAGFVYYNYLGIKRRLKSYYWYRDGLITIAFMIFLLMLLIPAVHRS